MTALEEIKKALEGVTPGPWFEGDKWVFVSPRSGLMNEAFENVLRNDEAQANARYIAAVNPSSISEILSTLESLQRENEELVARANEAVTAANALQVRVDTAEAEVKRLQAEIDRKSSMPGDHRYWEGRYRDEAAENDRLREALQKVAETEPSGHLDFHKPKHSGYAAFEIARTALASTGGEHHGN